MVVAKQDIGSSRFFIQFISSYPSNEGAICSRERQNTCVRVCKKSKLAHAYLGRVIVAQNQQIQEKLERGTKLK